MNNIEKVQEVMKDVDFVKKISIMEEPEDVQKAFAEKGVNFTLEEIGQIAEMVAAGNDDELTEVQMDSVSGGILAEIAIVASGIALLANTMAEINKNRKAAGKKTIW
jgi:predicted ribosomally synthesized peptide with nif11-like leader